MDDDDDDEFNPFSKDFIEYLVSTLTASLLFLTTTTAYIYYKERFIFIFMVYV